MSRASIIYSEYRHPKAKAETPYGVFGDQKILGVPATLTFSRIEDGDLRAKDIFGHPISRGDLAIHISGKDDYGQKVDHAQEIRDIGWSTTEFHRPGVSMGGAEPHAAIITSDRAIKEYHISAWGRADGYLTMAGLNFEMKGYGGFTAGVVARRLDSIRKMGWTYDTPQHRRPIAILIRALKATVSP